MKEWFRQKDPRSMVASLFAISTLLILPLVFKTDYTDLFITKYVYYYISALIAIGFILIAQFYIFIKKKSRWEITGRWEIALIVFLGICIISTLQSDFVYESFWGNEGRYNGLFLMLLYGVTTYLVGRHLKMKQWYFDLLLLGGVLVILIGLGDYFDLNILNFKHNMSKDNAGYTNFSSTVGNINFYTSYVALILGCAAGGFSVEKDRRRLIYYYVCFVIAFFGILTGNSDSGYLAIAAIFALLPLYCLKTRVSAARYVLLLATAVSLVETVGWINVMWSERVLVLEGLLSKITGTGTLIFAIGLWLLTGFLYYRNQKKEGYGSEQHLSGIWRYVWVGILLFFSTCLIVVLFDVNVAGNVERYGGLEQYLHFDDEWGTYRGYVWRIAWGYYLAFSPLHKLFGYGLETFPILTIYNDKWDMAYLLKSFYDSVHNEYLQYLLGIGAIGVAAYVAFLATSIKTMIKGIAKAPYLLGAVIGVTAYLAQAVVNISTVNVAAVLWLLIALGMAACRKPAADSGEIITEENTNGEKGI